MQHPDEGTIHSWLDGALPAEEAARLEAHVGTCQSCAAAVAEARGFIAASSRILTALDDVPRGVVPAVPERKRDLRVFWRAAAAMLVVAGGSLLVMREGGLETSANKGVNDSASFTAASSPGPANPVAAEGVGTSVEQSKATAISERPALASRAREGKAIVAGEQDLSARGERRRAEPEASGVMGGVVTGVAGGVASGRIAADAAAPTSAPAQRPVMAPAVEDEAALKVLKVERTLGSRRTIYEISPSQTVTLTEPEPVLGTVVTAQGAAQPTIRLRGNNAMPSRVEAAPAAPPPPPVADSRTTTDSVLVSREAAVAKTAAAQAQTGAAFTAASNSISWKEARTGKTLTLSGNLPVERLQEIRQHIERERAGAGARR